MSDDLPPDKYRCAACCKVFEKAWSDAEAESELAEKFPGYPVEETDIVCDDCYKQMGFG